MTGFYILIAGVAIAFLAFVFAAVHMGMAMTDRSEFSITSHLGAAVGIAFGGVVGVIGIIVAIIEAIQYYG